MIVRAPTEIDDPDWYPLMEHGYHSGCISPEMERSPEDKPRRRIGFHFEEPEPEPVDPSWWI